MPRYDYSCPDHGEFEAAVTWANAEKPQPCPALKVPDAPGQKIGHSARCRRPCQRVPRLYAPGIKWCDGMTQHAAVKDSEATKKYGHTI